MADNNSRAARLNGSYRHGGHAASGNGQNDPLAELARLIGQTDPFAEFGTNRAPESAGGTYPEPQPQQSKYVEMTPPYGGYGQQAPAQHYQEEDYAAYAQPAHHDPHYGYQPEQPSYRDPHPYQDAQHYQQGYPDQRYADPPVGTASAPYQAPTYAAAGYAVESDAHGYQPDPYHDDRQSHQDEALYDDLPPRRRRGAMLMVVAILCLAVVGTAGAFAYRSFVGGSRGTTPPPVIKADTTPSKVVPAVQTADAQSNKLIYDRLAGATPQGERVVSREEQPVEMKDPRAVPARMVFPPSPSDTTSSAGGSVAVGEPRRIRTVTIRPDQDGNAVTTETPRSEPPRAATPRAVPPAPRPSPPPVQLSPQASAAPPPPSRVSNAPLSLSPEAPIEPARRQAVAAMTPQLAAAPSASGSYLVQISSQRSEGDALASFRSMQSRFPAQLGSRSAIVRRADLGDKGVYYRSMVGPFASAEAANQFCGQLKSAGGQCLVQRN